MKNFLVIMDNPGESLKIADYAIAQASKEKAKLIILGTIGTEPWHHGKFPYDWGSSEVLDKVYASDKTRKQYLLDNIKKKAEKCGVQSLTDIVLSPINISRSVVISDYANDKQIDLIIIGIKKRSTFARFFLGDAKANVYRQTPCPVLVIK